MSSRQGTLFRFLGFFPARFKNGFQRFIHGVAVMGSDHAVFLMLFGIANFVVNGKVTVLIKNKHFKILKIRCLVKFCFDFEICAKGIDGIHGVVLNLGITFKRIPFQVYVFCDFTVLLRRQSIKNNTLSHS